MASWNVYLTGGPVFHEIRKSNTPAPKSSTLPRERTDVSMNKADLSPKEMAWNRILNRVDALMEKEPSGGRTREQIVAAFLKTPEGSRLYNAYNANQDPDEMEKAANTTLKDWAWSVMEKMESDEQVRNPAVGPMDVIKTLSRNKTYQNLYQLYNDPDSGLPAAQAMERIGKRNAGLAHAFSERFGG